MYDVLIIGGGNAGISAAARLLKKGVSDVAVIEPKQVHTYKPLLSYVGAGQAPLTEAERTQRSVTPRAVCGSKIRSCRWIRQNARFAARREWSTATAISYWGKA